MLWIGWQIIYNKRKGLPTEILKIHYKRLYKSKKIATVKELSIVVTKIYIAAVHIKLSRLRRF